MANRLEIDLPYINGFRDRHGKMRYFLRRKGFKRVALHGEPGSEQFLAEYRLALENAQKKPEAHKRKPGSFDALCWEYLDSGAFKDLAESTRGEMRRVIERLAKEHGDKPVAALERRHILRWRDNMKNRPGAANTMLRTMKQLLTAAIDYGYRKDNPAFGIKLLKLGRWRAWTDEEMAAFEARWPLGTLERSGYALALYTAQRREDLTTLKWSSIAGDVIRLTQKKTGTRMAIPIHPDLKAALSAVHPRRDAAILTGKAGGALHPVYFGHLMAGAIEAAGLPDDCVLHGLRKTTARLLAERGLKASPITGHLTDSMEREYTRDAKQEKLARSTVAEWGKNRA